MSEAQPGPPAPAPHDPGPQSTPSPPAPSPPPPGSSRAPAARSFSCTVFTFGQTGSGKTYTLTGPPPQVGPAPGERGGNGSPEALGSRTLPGGRAFVPPSPICRWGN